MNSSSSLPHPRPDIDARALLAAAIAGARRSLRGYPTEIVEEAAANAVAAVVAALHERGAIIRAPEAFAASAGRNSGSSFRQAIERDTGRRASLGAAAKVPAEEAIAGLYLAEARMHLSDTLAIARAAAAECGSRELHQVAAALARVSDAQSIELTDPATRRRLARGAARLLPLLAV